MILASKRKKSKFISSLTMGLGLLLLGFCLFYFGSHQTNRSYLKLLGKNQKQQDTVAQLQQTITELNSTIAKLEQTLEIERFQHEKQVELYNEQQNQIFEAQEKLKFYKISLGVKPDVDTISIRKVNFKETNIKGNYKYHILLAAPKHTKTSIEGDLQFTILGKQGNHSAKLQLRKENLLTETTFKLKLVQEVQGLIKLPDDFKPEKVTIQAKMVGRNGLEEKTFDWPSPS